MPFRIATQVLREVFGSSATAWLIILIFFPLAAAGASVAAGGNRWRRLSAALFMVCNPVVVDRVREVRRFSARNGPFALAVRRVAGGASSAEMVRGAPGAVVRTGDLGEPSRRLAGHRGGARGRCSAQAVVA